MNEDIEQPDVLSPIKRLNLHSITLLSLPCRLVLRTQFSTCKNKNIMFEYKGYSSIAPFRHSPQRAGKRKPTRSLFRKHGLQDNDRSSAAEPLLMESTMNDAKKRDFVAQMISLVEAEQDVLTDKGFNPTERLDALKVEKQAADSAETAQQEAAAKAQEATAQANQTLATAYKDASDFADLMSGLLGKDNELVRKMRKFRK